MLRGAGRFGRQRPLLAQEPDDLAYEERVALRLGVDRLDESHVRLEAADGFDESRDVLVREAPKQDTLEEALAGQLGEGLAERVAAREIDVAVGADEHDVRLGELPSDELEQEQRALIRPVEVVQDDHEGPGATRFRQEACHRVEEAEAGLLLVGRAGGHLQLRQPLANVRHELGDLGGARAELVGQLLGSALTDTRSKHLHPRPVRRRASLLPAASPVDLRAVRTRSARQLLRKAALADPRLAADDHQPPAARERVSERSDESGELALSPHEHPVRPTASNGAGVGRSRRLVCHGLREDVERRVLTEDRLLELHDRPARREAELVHQHVPRVLVGVQRLGLPAGAVKREHQLPAQPLAQRMTRDEGLELGDDLVGTSEREVGLDPFLDGGQAELLEAGDLLLRERVEAEVGERRSAPEIQRLAEERRRLVRFAAGERRPRPGEKRREAVRVELSVLDPENVARRPGQQDASLGGRSVRPLVPGIEDLAKPGDVSLDDLRCGGRRAARPRARRSGDRSRRPRSRATGASRGPPAASPPRAQALGRAARSPADRGRETPSTPRFGLGRT